MKVLCCGDRNWTCWKTIWSTLRPLGPLTEVVEGEARGADKMSRYVAEKLGYPVHKHPAAWDIHGKAAGVIRNQEMLDNHPDIELVLAFHDNLEASKGTKDMVSRARAKGIPVNVIISDQTTEG
jgi:hypothetical protein